MRTIVDQVRTFSDYLGDEIVLAVPAVPESESADDRGGAEAGVAGVPRKAVRSDAGSDAPMLVDNPRSARGVARSAGDGRTAM